VHEIMRLLRILLVIAVLVLAVQAVDKKNKHHHNHREKQQQQQQQQQQTKHHRHHHKHHQVEQVDFCLDVATCNTKCKSAYDRKVVHKPVLLKSLDNERAHLSCCKSGCYRRTGRNQSECIASCESSPWVPPRPSDDEADDYDRSQLNRTAAQRLPTHPTLLELEFTLSNRTHNATHHHHKHKVQKHHKKKKKKHALPGPPYEGLDSDSPSVHAKLATALTGIPSDVLAYMRKQQELKKYGASFTLPGGTYLTVEEKRENTGYYHKHLCILGCKLRCPSINQDQVVGPVEKQKR